MVITSARAREGHPLVHRDCLLDIIRNPSRGMMSMKNRSNVSGSIIAKLEDTSTDGAPNMGRPTQSTHGEFGDHEVVSHGRTKIPKALQGSNLAF